MWRTRRRRRPERAYASPRLPSPSPPRRRFFLPRRTGVSAAGAVLRTPEARFGALPDYPFPPRWVELEDGLRVHYAAAGPAHGPAVLLLHGEPSWSYLWRHDLLALEA